MGNKSYKLRYLSLFEQDLLSIVNYITNYVVYYVVIDDVMEVRQLRHIRTETKEQDGYTQTYEVYGCADCSGCEHKVRCLYKYDAEKMLIGTRS